MSEKEGRRGGGGGERERDHFKNAYAVADVVARMVGLVARGDEPAKSRKIARPRVTMKFVCVQNSINTVLREGGRDGVKEEGWEEGREEGTKERRREGRQGGRGRGGERERERGSEGARERGSEGARERGRGRG